VVTVVIFYNLPAAVGLYWLVTSIFSVVQQLIVNKNLEKIYGKPKPGEDFRLTRPTEGLPSPH